MMERERKTERKK
jgi:hypothetical protein